jgi:hypothetical protein
MTGRLTKTGRCYGMGMNVEKAKVIRICRETSPFQIMTDQKKLENVEYFSYLGSMITDDVSCTCEIRSMTAMAKAAVNREKSLLSRK